MKINLTPAAISQVELIGDMEVIQTGFIIGSVIGKHIIIQQLFPVHFDESNIDQVYGKMFSRVGEHLVGVFFNHSEPFFSDWFLEDVVLKINHPIHQSEFYLYDIKERRILATDKHGWTRTK
jgi:hypothetical protein